MDDDLGRVVVPEQNQHLGMVSAKHLGHVGCVKLDILESRSISLFQARVSMVSYTSADNSIRVSLESLAYPESYLKRNSVWVFAFPEAMYNMDFH